MATKLQEVSLKQAPRQQRQKWGTRLAKNKLSLVGTGLLLVLVMAAALAGYLSPYDPLRSNFREMLSAPSMSHPFGTDNYGRDLLTRVLFGMRLSLNIGVSVMVLSGVAGLLLGLLSGYFSRWDNLIMRAMDVLMAFPAILLAIAIMAILGTGYINSIIALSVVYAPRCARIVRSSTLSIKGLSYIEACRALGMADTRIIFRHILPNCLAPLVIQVVFVFAYAILADAALSFIGVGTPPPTPSLGNILADGRDYMDNAPWMMIFPGLVIAVLVLALNLAGDGLRDALDPKMR